MKFINEGNERKIRIGTLNNCYWINLKPGMIVDIPVEYGEKYRLKVFHEVETEPENVEVQTTAGKIKDQVIETKQIEPSPIETPKIDFEKELLKIKGIGKKIAKDIITFGSREKLIKEIKANNELPLRDDIVEKLRKHYGRIDN